MGNTFTSWSGLVLALQQEVAEATAEVIDGRYTRTGTLRMSPESEFSGGGSVSSGEIRLNTGHRYSPSGRDTQTIYNYAEDGGLLGNGGFWSRTMNQVPRHIQESFGSRFS